jgi:hypothetical protein
VLDDLAAVHHRHPVADRAGDPLPLAAGQARGRTPATWGRSPTNSSSSTARVSPGPPRPAPLSGPLSPDRPSRITVQSHLSRISATYHGFWIRKTD